MRRHRPTRLRLKRDAEATTKAGFRDSRSFVHLDGRWYCYGADMSAQREKCMKRDGGRCVRCGSIFWLEAHHRKPRSRGRDDRVDNLETLCKSDHTQEHGRFPRWTPRTVEAGAA